MTTAAGYPEDADHAETERELIAFVKHDCPVCDQVLPVLDEAAAAGVSVRLISQSSPSETAEQARRLRLRSLPEVDQDLAVSARFDPAAVPAVVLLEGGEERSRIEGLDRSRLRDLGLAAGAELRIEGLPERRPGCSSRTRDPEFALRLAARRARA
jgi:hypothetical protein